MKIFSLFWTIIFFKENVFYFGSTLFDNEHVFFILDPHFLTMNMFSLFWIHTFWQWTRFPYFGSTLFDNENVFSLFWIHNFLQRKCALFWIHTFWQWNFFFKFWVHTFFDNENLYPLFWIHNFLQRQCVLFWIHTFLTKKMCFFYFRCIPFWQGKFVLFWIHIFLTMQMRFLYFGSTPSFVLNLSIPCTWYQCTQSIIPPKSTVIKHMRILNTYLQHISIHTCRQVEMWWHTIRNQISSFGKSDESI